MNRRRPDTRTRRWSTSAAVRRRRADRDPRRRPHRLARGRRWPPRHWDDNHPCEEKRDMSNTNEALVRSAYDAYPRGDITAMLDNIDADLEWTYGGRGAPPGRTGPEVTTGGGHRPTAIGSWSAST